MARGLGLMDAIGAYQDGVAWRKQKEQADRLEAVNAEFRDAYSQAEQADAERQRSEWLKTSRVEGQTDPGPPSAADLASGTGGTGFQPKPFRPDDIMMLDLHEKRRNALLKHGFVEQAVQSEAIAQGQRMRIRQQALEKFRLNKDHAALAAAIYDTIPDGKKVVGAETIEGAPGADSPTIGNWAAIPTKIKFKLSDGSTHTLTPQEVEDIALRMSDPKIAENEARVRLEKAIAAAKGEEARATAREEGRIKVDTLREGSRLKTEELGVEYGFKGSLADAERKFRADEGAKDRSSRERVAGGNNAATRYAADQGLAGAKARAAASENGGKGKRLKSTERQTMAENSFGKLTQGGFGSKRVGDSVIAKLVEGWEAYLDENPDASESEAMNAAADALRKRGMLPEIGKEDD